MARSIYQGSAAAVCQARELSARRRARGLEKKATGSLSIPLPFSRFISLFTPFSFSLSCTFSFSTLLSLSLSPSPVSLRLSPLVSHPTSLAFSPLSFVASGVIFHRCSGRQKRRDGGGGGGVAADTYTRRRAWLTCARARTRERETARGGGWWHPLPRYTRSRGVQCARLSDISS